MPAIILYYILYYTWRPQGPGGLLTWKPRDLDLGLGNRGPADLGTSGTGDPGACECGSLGTWGPGNFREWGPGGL